ncbi:Bug family tripartite tricarboxylate transporter substrate binding protein [Paracandidimonas soli]|uniref:Tripartite-type tricarboxylate transporter receptor subunit TctC n=1 Tax=Paracandidimonas soli TaxID=1917182 RepID=A0A4R3UYU8_9BURK|nr:tripartite tricarboxylate transporter substrate-binding protein [Paracandidimonas soli]TCU96043.1 tripartite-type tricarboxylate transporter receptor subunit TctC [Paracandidimonas soli]
MKRIIVSAFACLMCLISATSWAKDNYPTRPVTWVVPFAAGGPTDALARRVAARVANELGQAIVIENVPGAGGTIGAARVARAKPDGYTMLMGHFGYMAAAPSLYNNLAYDPAQDFRGVFRFPNTPMVLLVGKDSPFNTIEEFVSYARTNPNKLNIANAGVGSASHLMAALFMQRANLDVLDVPYRGGGQALTDVISGQADALFDQMNTVMGLRSGGLAKPLVQTTTQRTTQLPDIPTVAESLIPGFEALTWYGVYAPAGTDDEVLQKFLSSYHSALQDPEFLQLLQDQGLQLLSDGEETGAALDTFTRAEIQRWKQVIAAAGIERQ